MARELKEIIGDLLTITTAGHGWVYRGIDVRALCAEASDELDRFNSTPVNEYIALRHGQARQVITELRNVVDAYEAQLDRPARQ